MFKQMEKKKSSKQLPKISPKKKLCTRTCNEYKQITSEDKIRITYSTIDKSLAHTYNVNTPEEDKKFLKTKEKNIKRKKKEDSKVQNENNLKNHNAAVRPDCNKHNKIHKSNKTSTSNNTKISPNNDKVHSAILKTQVQNINKKNKREDSKIQNENHLKNNNAAVHTEKRNYSQINDCFVLLSDCNKHKQINKLNKNPSSNNTKISSKNGKVHSAILKTQGKEFEKNKMKHKVKNINYLENDDHALVHTKKRHNIQIKECFVLLSDFNEHKKINKSNKASTRNKKMIGSDNNKKKRINMNNTKTKHTKKKKKNDDDSKVNNINNLENDIAAAVHTEKKHNKINDCFVILTDFIHHSKKTS